MQEIIDERCKRCAYYIEDDLGLGWSRCDFMHMWLFLIDKACDWLIEQIEEHELRSDCTDEADK